MIRLVRILSVVTLFVALSAAGHAQALFADLTGSAEAPPNASPATGFGSVILDQAANTMSVSFTFAGLVGTTTAAHIHATTAQPFAGTAMVATQIPRFVGFPVGVTSGTYSNTFDMSLASSYNPAFISANGGTPLAAEAALFDAIRSQRAYLNIHTNVFPGGEIRGFFTPEPGASALLCGLLAGGGLFAWRRRR